MVGTPRAAAPLYTVPAVPAAPMRLLHSIRQALHCGPAGSPQPAAQLVPPFLTPCSQASPTAGCTAMRLCPVLFLAGQPHGRLYDEFAVAERLRMRGWVLPGVWGRAWSGAVVG